MATDTKQETREGPWANRPERQQFFAGDAVIATVTVLTMPKRVTVEVPCRVERVHEPEPYVSINGPRARGWRYTVRPTDEPNPHAMLMKQRELRLATFNAAHPLPVDEV